MNRDALLFRYRLVLGAFIIGLVLSGVTAFPLLHELELLARMLGIPADTAPATQNGLQFWIATVRDGLRDVHTRHPWLAYGTDWLAFGHIVIAMFFIGPWREPIGNAWVLRVGGRMRRRHPARAPLRADSRHPVLLAAHRLQLWDFRCAAAALLPAAHAANGGTQTLTCQKLNGASNSRTCCCMSLIHRRLVFPLVST